MQCIRSNSDLENTDDSTKRAQPQWDDIGKQNHKTKHVSVPRTIKTLSTPHQK